MTTAFEPPTDTSTADRYRLAWLNARERVAAYADALDDRAEECAALRARLAELEVTPLWPGR